MTSKALVLGGGGPVGIAWESGLLNGLANEGVDLSTADFILGTSAGSFVGAYLAMGNDVRKMAAPFMAMREAPPSDAAPGRAPPDLTTLTAKMAEIASGERPAQVVRAELGAWAAAAETMSEDAFIRSLGRFLADQPEDAWPARRYACTAVDIETGAFQLWDNDSGVGVARAVASSCSVPGVFPPITLKGRRYMDGGMRSTTNADLAKGYDVVAVVAVRTDGGQSGAAAERMRARLEAELEVLRAAGSEVLLITPDEASKAAFGPNLLDARRRPPAAEAGLAQGRAQAAALREAWSG